MVSTDTEVIDLTWVEFSEKQDICCDTIIEECSKQALWIAKFHSTCGHWSQNKHYCDKHMEVQLGIEKWHAPLGGRACGRVVHKGATLYPFCDGRFWMIYNERLKQNGV